MQQFVGNSALLLKQTWNSQMP